jgi:hypothetical protein
VNAETDKACERIAAAMANRLWLSLDVETLAEMVDHAHEPDEDGVPAAYETLWDAVFGMCLTTAVANHDRDIPLLQAPPEDKHNPG